MSEPLVDALAEGRSLGYLGPGAIEPHISHAEAFAEATPHSPARALDLGAGGGLPGLVLAARHWPEARWTFLDAQAKRTAFLVAAVQDLGLGDRVEVVTARAEEIGRDPAHRGGYDLVVSRSFGPPAVTAECAAGLLSVGGALVVSEPPTADTATRWPATELRALGLGPAAPRVVTTTAGPVHLVVIHQVEAAPDRYPRRTGMPGKRPLF